MVYQGSNTATDVIPTIQNMDSESGTTTPIQDAAAAGFSHAHVAIIDVCFSLVFMCISYTHTNVCIYIYTIHTCTYKYTSLHT